MGSGVTRLAHSKLFRVVAVALLLGTACLEPATQLETAAAGAVSVHGCSPLSCTGCCLGDVCMGGNTDDACGYDGRACVACDAAHRCEAPGACYVRPEEKSAPSPESAPDGGSCQRGQPQCP